MNRRNEAPAASRDAPLLAPPAPPPSSLLHRRPRPARRRPGPRTPSQLTAVDLKSARRRPPPLLPQEDEECCDQFSPDVLLHTQTPLPVRAAAARLQYALLACTGFAYPLTGAPRQPSGHPTRGTPLPPPARRGPTASRPERLPGPAPAPSAPSHRRRLSPAFTTPCRGVPLGSAAGVVRGARAHRRLHRPRRHRRPPPPRVRHGHAVGRPHRR